MQHVLSLAFDVSEFSHLIVQVPQLHKDLTLVVLIMLFSSASTFLLLQMDFGLGEEGNSGVVKRTSADKSSVFPDSFERLWYYLTIFLLDMPFLVIRLTVMVSFPESIVTFQLVYLLKNVISMVYGIVQIVHKSKTESTDTCTNPNTIIVGSWPRSPYCESDM
jgi:divalent metal cation (Fe/Co/Zn/Cd) transporter